MNGSPTCNVLAISLIIPKTDTMMNIPMTDQSILFFPFSLFSESSALDII